jgi:hypothetical protein
VNRRSPVVAGQEKTATSFGTVGSFDVVEAGTMLSAPQLTTTQRDALTSPRDGSLIYNTTTNKIQCKENGSWVNLT